VNLWVRVAFQTKELVMCNFLSAIVVQSGEILWDPTTDSHEDLMTKFNIRDGLCQQGKFVRIEFTHPEDHTQIADLSKWNLKVDEESTPDWFNHEEVRYKLSAIVKEMLVSGEKELLSGGCCILLDGANVGEVKDCRIYCMLGNSKVGKLLDTSKVECMHDSSKVGTMYNSSQVGIMCNSSKVGNMYDSSKVEYMYDSSKVGIMQDSSRIESMFNYSKVGSMRDSSQVGDMFGSSQIESRCGSSKVTYNISKV
jgi:hypothetical protein